MADIDPKIIAGGAGAVVGGAFIKDTFIDDDSAEGATGSFDLSGTGDLTGVGDGADIDAGGDYGSDYGEAYDAMMQEQANYEMTSEMMETMHQTNMEVIDNIDGSDDYYYTDDPYDW